MAKLIEQTYGQALFELAREENKISLLFDEAKLLKAAFEDGDDFIRFVKNPRITQDEKRGVLESSLKGRISDEMLGFLVILNQKERLYKVEDILEYFISMVKEMNHEGKALVLSALELSSAQRETIREKLLSTTGYKEIDVEFETDPDLIGGLVIRVGDRVLDSSLKTRLYTLKRDLIQIKV